MMDTTVDFLALAERIYKARLDEVELAVFSQLLILYTGASERGSLATIEVCSRTSNRYAEAVLSCIQPTVPHAARALLEKLRRRGS